MEEADAVHSPETTASLRSAGGLPTTRPRRPCDACRKRKSRCEISLNDAKCVLCQFHGRVCTFVENPPKKRRRVSGGPPKTETRPPVQRIPQYNDMSRATSNSANTSPTVRNASVDIRKDHAIKDYADLRGPSLLKKTLGLQNHRHSSLLGPSAVYEPRLLGLRAFCEPEDIQVGASALRKVGSDTFILTPDDGTRNHDQEVDDLDAIESIIAPHGRSLINLYFRIVHPTFPILHKKVFLEKYDRTHREFSPPLLAAVYILALNWWSYSSELALLPKPNLAELEEMAFKTMSDVVHRPKLSTIQAGLLLLQRPDGDSWAIISQLVGLGQDLGLHLDCASWRIPSWEKGLRKRLAWALYMADKWGSLVHGRPSHITSSDWDVEQLDESDFPENAADEDDEEGSTEVEKGRLLFCEMIELTKILSDVLVTFYTLKTEAEMRHNAHLGVGWVLQRAKPLQLRLRSWFTGIHESLRLQNVTMRKLSSVGYLHLAYYAAEITLHRPIVRALEAETHPDLIQVCRLAARERLVNTIECVNALRPEHLQSFWYSASKYCFALVGTFISLLWVTSRTKDEAEFYARKLDEYRWSLRLSSKNAEILERAITTIATSTGILVKAIPVITHAELGPEGEGVFGDSFESSAQPPETLTAVSPPGDSGDESHGSPVTESEQVAWYTDMASIHATSTGVAFPTTIEDNQMGLIGYDNYDVQV